MGVSAASRHRKLALFGDEQEQHTDERMIERLLRLIGVPQPRIGYIPEASYLDRGPFGLKRDFYAGIGATLAVYFDEETPDGELGTLLECDAIHLSGGNTFTFLYWLRARGMLSILCKYVEEGGILIGVSAGSIMMTPSVSSAALCGDPPDPRLSDYSALGLVDFHFWPHFDPNRQLDAQEAEFVASLPDLYACAGGAGIVVDGDAIELFGAVDKYPTIKDSAAS